MEYYAIITNGVIDGKGQCPCEGDNTFSVEITEEIYNELDRYIYSNGEIILDPDYEEKQAQKREAEFRKEFFETSLGWIRRSVNMADGSKKDFLSDLLPAISMALNMGQIVNIITYTLPDFSHEITDWTIYQEIKQVTAKFIQECFNQLNNDFLG